MLSRGSLWGAADRPTVLALWALSDERFLRAHDAELVSFRVGQDSPGLSAGLPDADPTRPEREKAVIS